MNDESNWWNRARNENAQAHEQEPRSGGERTESAGLAAGKSRDEGAERVDLPSYGYAPGTSAVIHKATSIAVSLNHAEITVAHLIAAIMLTPGAVDPFNEGRLNRALAPLNPEIALEGALRLLLQDIKCHTGEQTETPLRSRELNDLFRGAAKFVIERAPEHRELEVADILKVIAEVEPVKDYLVEGKPVPSLGDLNEAVLKLDDSIKQMTFTGLGAVQFSVEEVRRSLENHAKEFKDVVSAPEENRPVPGSMFPRPEEPFGIGPTRPTIENTVLKLRDIVAAVDKNRSATDTRLSALVSSVDKLGLVTASAATRFDTMQAEAASLQEACSKALALSRVFAIAAASALVAIAVIGLAVGYKVWNL
jgi:hypothetical protein